MRTIVASIAIMVIGVLTSSCRSGNVSASTSALFDTAWLCPEIGRVMFAATALPWHSELNHESATVVTFTIDGADVRAELDPESMQLSVVFGDAAEAGLCSRLPPQELVRGPTWEVATEAPAVTAGGSDAVPDGVVWVTGPVECEGFVATIAPIGRVRGAVVTVQSEVLAWVESTERTEREGQQVHMYTYAQQWVTEPANSAMFAEPRDQPVEYSRVDSRFRNATVTLAGRDLSPLLDGLPATAPVPAAALAPLEGYRASADGIVSPPSEAFGAVRYIVRSLPCGTLVSVLVRVEGGALYPATSPVLAAVGDHSAALRLVEAMFPARLEDAR